MGSGPRGSLLPKSCQVRLSSGAMAYVAALGDLCVGPEHQRALVTPCVWDKHAAQGCFILSIEVV